MKEMKAAIAGDFMMMTPFPSGYRGFKDIRSLIEGCNLRFCNLEMVISDYDCFASSFSGSTWLTAPQSRIDDLLQYGFNCIAMDNNHALDFSYDGLRSTISAVSQINIPYAGLGLSMKEASAYRTAAASDGVRAAFISLTSTI